MPAPRTPTHALVAVESLVEGCIGEGIAAAMAERAAMDEPDAEVRRAREIIAVDEARHAALAWSILEWTLAQDDAVRPALAAQLVVERSKPRPHDALAAHVVDEAIEYAQTLISRSSS